MNLYPIVLSNGFGLELSKEILNRSAELGYDIKAHAAIQGVDVSHEDWMLNAPIIRHHPALVQAVEENPMGMVRIHYVRGPYFILYLDNEDEKEYAVEQYMITWISPSDHTTAR